MSEKVWPLRYTLQMQKDTLPVILRFQLFRLQFHKPNNWMCRLLFSGEIPGSVHTIHKLGLSAPLLALIKKSQDCGISHENIKI